MMPFRVAIPNNVMNPIRDAIDNVPPDAKTITTPPISANGRFAITNKARRVDRSARYRRRKIPAMATTDIVAIFRAASSCASNWPPYWTK